MIMQLKALLDEVEREERAQAERLGRLGGASVAGVDAGGSLRPAKLPPSARAHSHHDDGVAGGEDAEAMQADVMLSELDRRTSAEFAEEERRQRAHAVESQRWMAEQMKWLESMKGKAVLQAVNRQHAPAPLITGQHTAPTTLMAGDLAGLESSGSGGTGFGDGMMLHGHGIFFPAGELVMATDTVVGADGALVSPPHVGRGMARSASGEGWEVRLRTEARRSFAEMSNVLDHRSKVRGAGVSSVAAHELAGTKSLERPSSSRRSRPTASASAPISPRRSGASSSSRGGSSRSSNSNGGSGSGSNSGGGGGDDDGDSFSDDMRRLRKEIQRLQLECESGRA